MSDYTAPVGAPIWIDLRSSNPDKAIDFYGRLFGWEADDPNAEFGGYRNFTLNGRPVAGLMQSMPDEPADVWCVYLRTDDAAATFAASTEAGATALVPPMPVGDLGTMTIVTDPAGAVVGTWQPGTHPGFVEIGTAGAPYWFDCMSQDYQAALAFYSKVFGYQPEEVGTGGNPDQAGPPRYSVVGADGVPFAGIMDANGMFEDGHPSFWQAYITADDSRASVAQAVELGGELVMPVEDTPYGAIGCVKDPNGAFIQIATPPVGETRTM